MISSRPISGVWYRSLGATALASAGRHRAFPEAPVQLLLVAHLDGDLGLAQHEAGQDDIALEQRP